MKTFLEDLGKRIEETVEIVGNKANEAMETQKLKNQIRTLERDNEKDYVELGKIFYKKFQNDEVVCEEAGPLCEAIGNRDECIQECKDLIAEAKGDMECAACGKSIAKDMAYCPYCGEKVPHDVPTEDDFVDESVEVFNTAESSESVESSDPVEEVVIKEADAEDVVEE